MQVSINFLDNTGDTINQFMWIALGAKFVCIDNIFDYTYQLIKIFVFM